MEEASRRLERAHLVYRERRDALAQFLLSRATKGAPASLAHRAQVERLAYQLWEEAGRPSGRAEEHWYLAERLLHSAA
jgi:hypothetical protein